MYIYIILYREIGLGDLKNVSMLLFIYVWKLRHTIKILNPCVILKQYPSYSIETEWWGSTEHTIIRPTLVDGCKSVLYIVLPMLCGILGRVVIKLSEIKWGNPLLLLEKFYCIVYIDRNATECIAIWTTFVNMADQWLCDINNQYITALERRPLRGMIKGHTNYEWLWNICHKTT